MLDPYIESILIFSGINIVLALSLYLPVSAGLLSLGQGGFMAIGAYVSGYMTSVMDWPFAVALICGGLVAGAVGFLVGIPSLRDDGVAILLTEHHMSLVMAISDHVTVMNYGRKIAEGTPDEVRRDPQVLTAYLGSE